MLVTILLIVAALIAVILIAASTKPNTVRYERSIVINASPDRILAQISDFRKWAPWSPWEKKDPDMHRDYSGSPSGVGAKYGWTGNSKVGEGRMEVTGTTADSVAIAMEFIKPWKAHCAVVFRTTSDGGGTRLTWTMDGPQIFMGKVMSLFMDMDKMIGKDFEAGLGSLKAVAERS